MLKVYDFNSIVEKDYDEIKDILFSSGILVYPTETSYAIGSNALDDQAVEKIFTIKGREAEKPLPIIVQDMAMLLSIAEVGRLEENLISKFWPGPLTLIFKLKTEALNNKFAFTGGAETVGARISPHPFTAAIFDKISFPLVSTSANLSGKSSFSSFDELLKEFLIPISGKFADMKIAAVNSGVLPGGASTVIKVGKKNIEILRGGENNLSGRLACSIKNNG